MMLTLEQRNLISDADEHINWLESRKKDTEQKLAKARDVLFTVSTKLTARHQEGWEARLLEIVNNVLAETKT